MVTAKVFAQIGLIGLLIGSAWACGGGGRRYDAKATYQCLVKRPEHHWTVDAGDRHHVMFIVGPSPVQSGYPTKEFEAQFYTTLGSGWVLPVMFFGRVEASVTVIVFDKAGAADGLYRTLLRRVLPNKLPLARMIYQRNRNLFIDWTTPSPPKPARSIILGCLRTSS